MATKRRVRRSAKNPQPRGFARATIGKAIGTLKRRGRAAAKSAGAALKRKAAAGARGARKAAGRAARAGARKLAHHLTIYAASKANPRKARSPKRNPLGISVEMGGATIAQFRSLARARQYGKALANSTGRQVKLRIP